MQLYYVCMIIIGQGILTFFYIEGDIISICSTFTRQNNGFTDIFWGQEILKGLSCIFFFFLPRFAAGQWQQVFIIKGRMKDENEHSHWREHCIRHAKFGYALEDDVSVYFIEQNYLYISDVYIW